MNRSVVHKGDISLSYRSVGSGETVMLVHGFAEDSWIWEQLAAELEHNYNVILPDLRGSGASMGDTTEITMEELAEDLSAILERENIGQCAMIGHSMGGYITLAFAKKYPEKLSRLGLFHSTAFADTDEKKEARKKNIEFIQKHGSAKFIGQSTPKLFAPRTIETNKELVSAVVDRYSNFSADSLVHYTEAMMKREERIDVLREFNKPVMFIMGEEDQTIPIEQGFRQCNIPGISYIYVCALSGHMGMLEEPAFSLESVRYFLSANQ